LVLGDAARVDAAVGRAAGLDAAMIDAAVALLRPLRSSTSRLLLRLLCGFLLLTLLFLLRSARRLRLLCGPLLLTLLFLLRSARRLLLLLL
jgi:hypothetical protein